MRATLLPQYRAHETGNTILCNMNPLCSGTESCFSTQISIQKAVPQRRHGRHQQSHSAYLHQSASVPLPLELRCRLLNNLRKLCRIRWSRVHRGCQARPRHLVHFPLQWTEGIASNAAPERNIQGIGRSCLGVLGPQCPTILHTPNEVRPALQAVFFIQQPHTPP